MKPGDEVGMKRVVVATLRLYVDACRATVRSFARGRTACPDSLPLPSAVGAQAYEPLLNDFLRRGCYRAWVHDRAVRNTYKVLLTRGMLGSVLYSTDRETQQLLTGLLQGHVSVPSDRVLRL